MHYETVNIWQIKAQTLQKGFTLNAQYIINSAALQPALRLLTLQEIVHYRISCSLFAPVVLI